MKPPYVWLQLTNRCNLKCSYCYMESVTSGEGERLPLEVCQRLATAYAEAGGTQIMLSGGEPTLYRDLVPLIEHCASVGLTPKLVTNGVHLSEAVMGALVEARATAQVSLDAVDPAVFTASRGRRGLSPVLSTTDRLLASGIPVNLSSAVTTRNVDTLAGVVDLALAKGISEVHFATSYWKADETAEAEADFSERFYRSLIDLYAMQLANYLFVSIDLIESLVAPMTLGVSREHHCNAMARETLEVLSSGDVYTCGALRDHPGERLGDVYGDGFDELVASLRRQPRLAVDRLQECRGCAYVGACVGGCRAAAFHRGGSITGGNPNCEAFKRFMGRVMADMEHGRLDEYADFLRTADGRLGGESLRKAF